MRRHERQLYRLAYRMTGNHEEAEDLIQETVLEAFTSFHYFQPGTRFDRWFSRIMTNNFIDRSRRRSRMKTLSLDQPIDTQGDEPLTFEIPDRDADPQSLIMNEVMDEEIQKALGKIPEEFRAVVVLSDIEELSYEEISQILKCPIGTVRSRLHRGRNLLKNLLKDYLRVEEMSQ